MIAHAKANGLGKSVFFGNATRGVRSTAAVLLVFAVVSTIRGRGDLPDHAGSLQPERPNILLVLTDDQGWPTIGCYGGELVATPNLDRLAAQGARFTAAYVTSQCTPTRATFLTGQYTARSRLWHVISWYGYPYARMAEPAFADNLSRDTFTLAKGLQAAGYKTAIVGKWHLTSNADGSYRGLNPEAAEQYGFDFAPPLLSNEEFAPGSDRGAATLTEQALGFIERNRDDPWFCFLSHHMIHGQVVAPDEITRKYRERGYGDTGPNRAVYLAGLECIDRSVGRLMQRLDDLGEADDTLFLFLSDNGGIDERLGFKDLRLPHPERPTFTPDLQEYDNAPLRAGKGSVYEGGIRVPFIARWPGSIRSGQVIDTPVHAIDLVPTCLGVAGATAPADHPLDGTDLVPLMTDGDDPALEGRALFQYYPFYDLRWGLTPCASIRLGDFKLIEFFGDRIDAHNRYVPGKHLELYNLRLDIGERQNLALSEERRARVLQEKLHSWMQGVGAPVPRENEHFDPSKAFLETRDKPE